MLWAIACLIELGWRVIEGELDRPPLGTAQSPRGVAICQVQRKSVQHSAPVVQGVAEPLSPPPERGLVERFHDECHRPTSSAHVSAHGHGVGLVPVADVAEEFLDERISVCQRCPDFGLNPGNIDAIGGYSRPSCFARIHAQPALRRWVRLVRVQSLTTSSAGNARTIFIVSTLTVVILLIRSRMYRSSPCSMPQAFGSFTIPDALSVFI